MGTADFRETEFLCPCCGKGGEIIRPALLMALQCVRNHWGKPMMVTSGYRCKKHNLAVGGRQNSAHMTGEAADIVDLDGSLKDWLDEDSLSIYGLWMEKASYCPNWCHLQVRASSRRIFLP